VTYVLFGMWMCGCCRLAVVRISARKRSAPTTAASSGRSTLTATRQVVSEVVSQVHRGHAAAPELALEDVSVLDSVAHRLAASVMDRWRWRFESRV
jgi:hypothetical protein